MQRAAANRAWCEAWDAASSELLLALKASRPDFDRVRALIRRRQRLTTAAPPADPDREGADQRRWLSAAVERERAIQSAFQEYGRLVGLARASFRANAPVREVYADGARSIRGGGKGSGAFDREV
jgi:hypothetical protein